MSRCIDADALEELFREVIGCIAKKPEMNGNLEHMVRASAMVIEMIKDAPTIEPEPSQVARDIATILENEQDMRVIVKNAQPQPDEWCTDCAEYDKQKNSCPRFNRVIRQTLDDVFDHAETEAEARYHAQRKKGEWKPFDLTYGRSIYACSCCGNGTEVPTDMGEPLYNYCPNCGADMREDGEADETRT